MNYSKRGSRVFLSLAAWLLLTSCAQTPLLEVRGYADAYAQARVAGDLLLDVVAPLYGDEAEPAKTCEINNDGFRECFNVALAIGPEAARRNEPLDIKVRRVALAQIAGYNQLLVDLAEGKSATALNQRIDAVNNVAVSTVGVIGGSLVGGVAAIQPVVAALKPVIARFEQMRASNAAAESILAAEGDVRALIRFMQEDTEALYDLFVADYRTKVRAARLALKRAELAPNPDTEETTRLATQLARMRDPESDENLARSFERSLIAYVKLLDTTDTTLGTLTSAIRAPTKDPIASATLFASQATEARMLAETFLDNVRTLRTSTQP